MTKTNPQNNEKKTTIQLTNFTISQKEKIKSAARALRFKHKISFCAKDQGVKKYPNYVQIYANEILSGKAITTILINQSDEIRKQARIIRFGMFT